MTIQALVQDERTALEAALVELECRPMSEFRDLLEPAAEALEAAGRIGADDLAQRAYLLQASIELRVGRLGEGGQIAQRVRAWAEKHTSPYVLARAHRELAIFYRHVGDLAESLSHGVACVQHLPDSTPPLIRARHLVTLAMTLDDSGSIVEGDRRSREALEIASTLGDPELTMNIINNMAYTAYENDDVKGAEALAARMRELQAETGHRMAANELDTLARVMMMTERYSEVEAIIGEALSGRALAKYSDAIAGCLLTLAEARRLAGRFAAAQSALDMSASECDERGLARIRAQVREEQAALYAATGRFAEAYEEHRFFHAEMTSLHNTQRDARARALQAVFETTEARRASEQFWEMAHRDALTGLYNRRYVNERLPALIAEAGSGGRPLALAIVDLDHFKRINDTLSHTVGDTVLQHVGELLQAAAPDAAIAARMGGEEFLLIFPGTTLDEAAARCELLRLEIRGHDWSPITGETVVTTSIGVIVTTDGRETLSSLLTRADRNLYAAKRTGRDRIVF